MGIFSIFAERVVAKAMLSLNRAAKAALSGPRCGMRVDSENPSDFRKKKKKKLLRKFLIFSLFCGAQVSTRKIDSIGFRGRSGTAARASRAH